MPILTLRCGDCRALVDSDRGGSLIRLTQEALGIDCLRTPDKGYAQNPFLYGTPPLLPPNRIAGARFDFAGQRYTLPLNEPETGCSLHGALHALPLSVEALSETALTLRYRARAGEYLGFPHAFSLALRYTLSPDGAAQTLSVRNDSDAVMPFAIGWHTTFRLPFVEGGDARDVAVRLSASAEYPRDARTHLPTWEETRENETLRLLRAGTLTPASRPLSVLLGGAGQSVTLFDRRLHRGVVYDAPDYPYWLLFNGGADSFLSCEPLSCVVDAPHAPWPMARSGLIALPPCAQRDFHARIACFQTRR